MSNPVYKEAYISVDVETSGPNPGQYSLLSIGACTLDEPPKTFYCELKPVNENALTQALEISRLSMDELSEKGLEPQDAMQSFAAWLEATVQPGYIPIFVAFNAAYDWMFVNDYFHRYLGRNPFGYTALDIKSYYMGLKGTTWQETSKAYLSPTYMNNESLTHHALQDAIDQGRMFRQMLLEATDIRTKGDR